MLRAAAVLAGLLVLYVATYWLADGLRFEPVKDEVHFLESSRAFARPFTLEALRSYPEVVTPLALVVWGQLERVTGSGLVVGRALNLMVSFGMVCLVAFASTAGWPRSALAAVGLLLFPYSLPLSVHLYTDVMATAFAMLGTLAVLRRRPAWAFVAFVCAIATRQYAVQVAAAMAAAEGLAWLRGDRTRWRTALACAAAAGTLLGWLHFFGGLAPRAGLEAWIPRYPAPMLEPLDFILHHALYALTGIGFYFVLVEAVLYRRLPSRQQLRARRNLILAAVLAVLFAIDPPFLSASHQGGPIGRVSRLVLSAPELDAVRVVLFYVLALLAVLRFSRRLDAASWVVAAAAVLSTKQQLPWEKYLLPTLAVLWLLRATGDLLPYGDGERTDATSKGLMKQPAPSLRFST